MQEMECKITGKVQMVMFRDFVLRKAKGLGISGTVENLEDRSVKVIAQGEEDALNKLKTHLHKGPFMARVLNVNATFREPTKKFKGFEILY